MRPPRPFRPTPPQPAIRPKRALLFILLAVCGLGVGAGLAHLKPHPPFHHATASVAWEAGAIVVRPAEGED